MEKNKSAEKRTKTSEKRRQANRSVKSNITTIRRSLYDTIASGEKQAAFEKFRNYCSALDKAAKNGVIKPNNASSCKSRLAARLAAMG